MNKERLKKWFKIIAFFVALAFAGLLIAGIIDSSGFVVNNFIKPVFYVIPLCIIVPAIILYVIYMFVEKGEPLRIIANILICVLGIYVVSGVTILKHSDLINLYRYQEIENSSHQIVKSIFEDSTVEKDGSLSTPWHYSIGDMLAYESTYNRYIVNTDDKIRCFVDLYCADNYILGFNRITKNLEKNHIDNIIDRNSYNEVLIDDTGSGEIDGINYNWSYGEFDITRTERYVTDFSVMLTYENSVYVVDVSFAGNERFYIDMEKETEKIVDLIKSTDIFVDYESNEPVEQQTTTEPQITTEHQSAENNEDIIEESATPLTEDEIRELYTNAHNLYAEWFSPANYLVRDWDNTLKIDSREFFVVNSTEITSVDLLKTEFAKYFDSEEIDEIIDKYYVMHNGKMYGDVVLDEGGYIPEERHKLTVKTNTDTECVLTITTYLGDSSQELDYRLKVIDGKWKFTGVFHWLTMEQIVLD